jgi:hypothetical protein
VTPTWELLALVLTREGSGGCKEDSFVVCAYLGPSLNLQQVHKYSAIVFKQSH